MTGHVRISLAAWAATVLGSLVLAPVFSGPFLFISAFLCALVTGTGILLQNLRAPRIVVPVVQLAVLVELLSLIFLRDTLRFGLVPWKETALEFNQQMVNAMSAINRFSAPLPPDDHLTLFAASVIAATGLLIHLIAVQLRQAAWAGLLLLTMYTVPAATVHGGLPALLFIPPAVGYIVLLSAEGRTRLSRWGRRISGVSHLDASEPIEASALGQAGRRIGLTVIVLAALVPALLPTLPEGVIGNGLAGGGGSGGGIGASISSTDPMLDMGKNLKRGDNVTALTYTGGPAGGTYLRLTALDQFDGNIWRISQRNQGQKITNADMLPPQGFNGDLAKVPTTKMKVEVSRSFRSQFAPVPYPLRSISLKDRWRYDPASLDVVSTNGGVVGGKDYNLEAYQLPLTPELLRDTPPGAEPDSYTSQVPTSNMDEIRQLTNDVVADAKGNRFQQAVLLQNFFRSNGNFTYSTDTDTKSGMTALRMFLLDDRVGYCEQFATGMALMARVAGIPSRVGIGFLPGQAGKDGQYVVRMHDMHAWPELYFQGLGWVRFEPTPSARVATTPTWTEQAAPVPSTPTTAPTTAPTTPGASVDPELERPGDRNLPDDNGLAVTETGNWFSNGGAKAIGIGLLVVVLLGIPWLIRSLTRRRRFARPPGRAGVEGLWAEIRDTSRDLGLDWSDSSTPRQLGEWMAGKVPEPVQPQARRLARGLEAVRYAVVTDVEVDLRSEAADVRKALWSQAKLVRRWRARLLPPSWRWYLNRGSAEASDLLDEFDLLLARIRTSLVPRRSRHAD
ncbi:transglutaminase [Kribbella sp. ALI-6-A]|uniref:transglutaminase family protein n=1 Tax=Kribbella sp. ALI-6-A TaxID=1933817 RepID=UPI00097C22FE|nr:DUF3488 and transglutaminase-like domain-containing protein [Kribbella sp. ALI-6-A]ONI69740.1 transglutaminase [Kribbella sp. ALI-6-A]